MQAHATVSMDHIKEAIRKIDDYHGPFKIGSVDLGRVIGKDNCIEVTDDIKVEHLYRKGRNIKSAVTFDGTPADTPLLTIGLCLDDDGKHTMFTSFYGKLAPKELEDSRLTDAERPESERFWNTHVICVTRDDVDLERSTAIKTGEDVIDADADVIDANKMKDKETTKTI